MIVSLRLNRDHHRRSLRCRAIGPLYDVIGDPAGNEIHLNTAAVVTGGILRRFAGPQKRGCGRSAGAALLVPRSWIQTVRRSINRTVFGITPANSHLIARDS